MTKTEREAVLNEQNHCCPCCNKPLSLNQRQTAYDAKKNNILCRQCAIVVFQLRHLKPCMVEYEASRPKPSPKSGAQQAVEAGRVVNTKTNKPYASWADALGEHPDWEYSDGRRIDKDGNIYDASGTVIGNTEEAQL